MADFSALARELDQMSDAVGPIVPGTALPRRNRFLPIDGRELLPSKRRQEQGWRTTGAAPELDMANQIRRMEDLEAQHPHIDPFASLGDEPPLSAPGTGPFEHDYLIDTNWATKVTAGEGTEGQLFTTLHGHTFRVYSEPIAPAVHAKANRTTSGQGTSFLVVGGDYTLSAPIEASTGGSGQTHRWIGAGPDSVEFLAGANDLDLFICNAEAAGSGVDPAFYIENIGFDVNGKTNVRLVLNEGAAEVHVTKCRFDIGSSPDNEGIVLGTDTRGVSIIDNYFVGSDGTGIFGSADLYIFIADNYITGLAVGISLSNCTVIQVHGNRLYQNDIGIQFGSNPAITQCLIDHNAITLGDSGIRFLAGVNIQASIRINNNNFMSIISATEEGIDFSTLNNAIVYGVGITDNTFSGDSTADAVGVRGPSVATYVVNSLLSGNTFVDIASGDEYPNWDTGNGNEAYHNISTDNASPPNKQALADIGSPVGHTTGGDSHDHDGGDGAQIDHGGLDGLGDDDHTQYSLVDGTRNFTGVVGGIDPTASNHLATKEYVDQAVSFIAEYIFNDTASGIGGIYFKMLDVATGEGESTFTIGAALGQGDDQAVFNFATDEGVPGVTTFESGIYGGHIHAEVTAGNRPTKLHFEIYTRTHPGGAETLRATSEESDFITAKTDLTLHATVVDDVAINATDRIVIKWLANVDAAPANDVTIALYAEGTTNSHLEVPTSTEVLSSVFLRQDGTTPLSANWHPGSFDIGNYDFTVRALRIEMGDTNFQTEVESIGRYASLYFHTADTDLLRFDRNTNTWEFLIGNTTYFTVSAAGLAVDVISELTGNAGVTIESVLLKDGNVEIHSNAELRFYDNGNYVGFEAPALAADQIWILPATDGNANEALVTDAGGTLSWSASHGVTHNAVHGVSKHTEHANWKVFYSDGAGDETELALGADGTFLQANGVAAAPTFAALVVADIPYDDATSDPLACSNTADDGAENSPPRKDHVHPTGLTVKEEDGAPSVSNVNEIKVTNATLTDNGGGSVSITTGGGGAGADHNILDGNVHLDSVADAVTRGSIIYGNSTPKWDELVVGAADTILQADGADISWVAPATAIGHAILDASIHTDSVADGVTRGSLIYGNSTPKWDELVIGGAGAVLGSDGTDAAWTVPKRSIILTAGGGRPTTTSGCGGPAQVEAGTNDVDYMVLDFDTATDEYAFWGPFVSPDNWDGGTFTAVFYWTCTGGGAAETVTWSIQMAARDDNDPIDDAWGAAVTVADTWIADGDVHKTSATGAITPDTAGTRAGGDLIFVRVMRDVSADDLGVDARLLSVKLEYTVNAVSD